MSFLPRIEGQTQGKTEAELLGRVANKSRLSAAAIIDTDTIFDATGTLIVVFNREGEIQRFNRCCETVTGYSEAEMKGHTVWDFLLVPEDRAAARRFFEQLASGQTGTYSQSTWIGKAGTRHTIVWSNRALVGADGDVEFAIASGIETFEGPKANESSEAKASSQPQLEATPEHSLEHRSADAHPQSHMFTELAREVQQLRLVTNALPALVAYIDLQHRYRFNNYAYEAWYGIPYQQLSGRQVGDVVSLVVYREMLPYLEEALGGKKVTYEAEMVQSSGQRLWASISYIPDVQNGQVKGVFSLMSDISDRKATERLKDEFVSVVSHELRTPLTSIHGSLRLLATGRLGELNGQGQELVDIALNNTERLTRLINDMLDLERIGSNQVSMTPAVCFASELIESATKAMQAMASDYGITLVASARSLKSGPIEVWADADHIMQALTNLLSNAIKFSPRGANVFLKAREVASGKKVEFSVKDYGRGIPSAKLEAIFERFGQVDSSDARERGGTGLGLAICREIVQQHRGRIWVKSLHGQGSTFYFTLPKPAAKRAATATADSGQLISSG